MMWLMEFKLAAGAAGVGEGVGVGVMFELEFEIPWQPTRSMMATHQQIRGSAVLVSVA